VRRIVDALKLDSDVEGVHADVTERGAIVCEGAVAEGWAGDRGEPAIEDGELGGETVEDRQIVRRVSAEVIDNAVGGGDVRLLGVVGADEALHVGLAVGACDSTEDLGVDGGEVMMRIRQELAAKHGLGQDGDVGFGGIGVGLVTGEAVDIGVSGLEGTEHVVEGTILQHENDHMF
jgi:hypothetical protein